MRGIDVKGMDQDTKCALLCEVAVGAGFMEWEDYVASLDIDPIGVAERFAKEAELAEYKAPGHDHGIPF